MTQQLNEYRFGRFWAVEYWLIRVLAEYDEIQTHIKLLKEMFGDNFQEDKYPQDNWFRSVEQLRKILKEQLSKEPEFIKKQLMIGICDKCDMYTFVEYIASSDETTVQLCDDCLRETRPTGVKTIGGF